MPGTFSLTTDEKRVLTLRKHWLICVQHLLPLTLLIIGPLVLLYLVAYTSLIPEAFHDTFVASGALINGALSLWFLLVWMQAFHIFTDYYLDIWIVTTKRIITVDQIGFFKRHIGNVRVDRIQDVTTEVSGLIATLFNIGTIRIKTAGATHGDEFVIRGVPNSRSVRDAIMRAHDSEIEQQKKERGINNPL